MKDWVLQGGCVNMQFLEEQFGAAQVHVTDTHR